MALSALWLKGDVCSITVWTASTNPGQPYHCPQTALGHGRLLAQQLSREASGRRLLVAQLPQLHQPCHRALVMHLRSNTRSDFVSCASCVGGWHSQEVCPHHRHLCGPPPPQPLLGKPAGGLAPTFAVSSMRVASLLCTMQACSTLCGLAVLCHMADATFSCTWCSQSWLCPCRRTWPG